MKNIITIAMVVWMLFVAGFQMMGLNIGFGIICATLILMILGGGGYFIYKKWLDNDY